MLKLIFRYSPSQVLIALSAILIMPIIIKNSAEELFGIYTICNLIIGIVLSITGGWINTSIIRFQTTILNSYSEEIFILVLSIVCSAISFSVVFIILISLFSDQLSVMQSLLVSGVALFRCVFLQRLAILRIQQRYVYYSSQNILRTTIPLFVMLIILQFNELNLILIYQSILVTQISLLCIDIYLNFCLSRRQPTQRINGKKTTLKYLTYGFPLSVTGFCALFIESFDKLFMVNFVSIETVSFYAFFFTIMKLCSGMFLDLITLSFAPVCVKIWEEKGYLQAMNAYNWILRLSFAVLYAMLTTIVIFSKEITTLLALPSFLNGRGLIPIFGSGLMLLTVQWILQRPMLMHQSTKKVSYIFIEGAVAGCLFCLSFAIHENIYLLASVGIVSYGWIVLRLVHENSKRNLQFKLFPITNTMYTVFLFVISWFEFHITNSNYWYILMGGVFLSILVINKFVFKLDIKRIH